MAPLLANEELKIEFEWKRAGAPEHQRREKAMLIATRGKATDLPVLRFTDRVRSAWSDELDRRPRLNELAAEVSAPEFWAGCDAGSVQGNALGSCLPLCGPNRHCETGICEAWQGVDVCRPGP